MILQRIPVLAGLFGSFRTGSHRDDPGFHGQQARARAARDAAAAIGRRWRAAAAHDPALKRDLLILGGQFVQPPVMMEAGTPQPATKDLYQCGREDGRRELANQLLSLMALTTDELNQLLEEDEHDLS